MKSMLGLLLCFIYSILLGSRTESPKHHNWFPSQSDIFVCPPPMLTVTRCIVRSLQRAIKHICAGPKLTRAMVTRTHTRFLTFLSHRFLFLRLTRCRGENSGTSVPVDCGRSACGGILFCFMACNRQTIRLSTTVWRVPLIGFNVSMEGLNTLWIVTQTFSAHSRHFPHFYLVIFYLFWQPVKFSLWFIAVL